MTLIMISKFKLSDAGYLDIAKNYKMFPLSEKVKIVNSKKEQNHMLKLFIFTIRTKLLSVT